MKRLRNTFCFFKKLSTHKGFELQLTLEKNFCKWYDISIENRHKKDHSGIQFTVELFRYFYFHILIYDFRHWDYENDKFFEYN